MNMPVTSATPLLTSLGACYSSAIGQNLSSSPSSVDRSRSMSRLVSSNWKHFSHCALLIAFILISIIRFTWISDDSFDPVLKYGSFGTLILYLFRFISLLALPQCLFNFLGLTIYNAFPDRVTLKYGLSNAPFVCIRVVTRGDFADLVKKNVERNLKTCLDVGLENFIIQVVTDKALHLPVSESKLRETIVPSTYTSSTGALYKARALQYCLEDENNFLGASDWIVHLDEETILTPNVVRGIINFVCKGKHEFGQGLITYANEEIVNILTTLADTYRVADDMGKLRFQFLMLHRPIFSWKGSFVVSKYIAEKDVTYDHGPDGSVAEDCYFSMIAYSKGYTFDFIEGEMWEKSPFTLFDFLQQRKRWLQGIYLVVHSSKIALSNKLFLALSLYSWITIPLSTSNLLLAWFCPLPSSNFTVFNAIVAFIGSVNLYMYIFGVFKSFTVARIGLIKFAACLVGAIVAIPFNLVIENVAVIWGITSHKYKFYVVQKQLSSTNGNAAISQTFLDQRHPLISDSQRHTRDIDNTIEIV